MKKVLVAAAAAAVLGLGFGSPASACTGSDGDSAATGVVLTNPATGGSYNVDAGPAGVHAGVSGSTGYIDVDGDANGAQVDGRSSDGAVDGRTTVSGSPGVCINGMP